MVLETLFLLLLPGREAQELTGLMPRSAEVRHRLLGGAADSQKQGGRTGGCRWARRAGWLRESIDLSRGCADKQTRSRQWLWCSDAMRLASSSSSCFYFHSSVVAPDTFDVPDAAGRDGKALEQGQAVDGAVETPFLHSLLLLFENSGA